MKRKSRKSGGQTTTSSNQEGVKSNSKSKSKTTGRAGNTVITPEPKEAAPVAVGVSVTEHPYAQPRQAIPRTAGKAWTRVTQDLSSKFWDGLIPMAALVLLTLTLHMVAAPIQGFWGMSGLLVYLVALLGLGVVLLNQAILQTHSEVAQAWSGLASGGVMWFVVILSERVGGAQVPGATILLMLVVLALISTILWKSVFPIGVKFFVLTVFLAAVARLWIGSQQAMAGVWPVLNQTLTISGYVALGALGAVFFWIIALSRERIQRLWAALWGWFWALQALAVFLGKLL